MIKIIKIKYRLYFKILDFFKKNKILLWSGILNFLKFS